MRGYLRSSCAVGWKLIFMQSRRMLLLAHKYAHIYAHIYASGIQALMIEEASTLIWKHWFKVVPLLSALQGLHLQLESTEWQDLDVNFQDTRQLQKKFVLDNIQKRKKILLEKKVMMLMMASKGKKIDTCMKDSPLWSFFWNIGQNHLFSTKCGTYHFHTNVKKILKSPH
jgi:hypothetical protein